MVIFCRFHCKLCNSGVGCGYQNLSYVAAGNGLNLARLAVGHFTFLSRLTSGFFLHTH